VQGAFLEAEPHVGVELAAFSERARADRARGAGPALEDAEGLVHRLLRMLGVVQTRARIATSTALSGSGTASMSPSLVGEVGEADLRASSVPTSTMRGELSMHHTLRAAGGDELRNETFAGAEVGPRRSTARGAAEVADRLPGAAGAVALAELAGDQVEILLRLAAAFLQDAVEIVAVFAMTASSATDSTALRSRASCVGQSPAEGIEGFLPSRRSVTRSACRSRASWEGDARFAPCRGFPGARRPRVPRASEGEEAQAVGSERVFEDVPGGVQRRARLRIPRRKAISRIGSAGPDPILSNGLRPLAGKGGRRRRGGGVPYDLNWFAVLCNNCYIKLQKGWASPNCRCAPNNIVEVASRAFRSSQAARYRFHFVAANSYQTPMTLDCCRLPLAGRLRLA